jgi:hypothetical protein
VRYGANRWQGETYGRWQSLVSRDTLGAWRDSLGRLEIGQSWEQKINRYWRSQGEFFWVEHNDYWEAQEKWQEWMGEVQNRVGSRSQGAFFRLRQKWEAERYVPLVPAFVQVNSGAGDYVYDAESERFLEDHDKGNWVQDGWIPDSLEEWRSHYVHWAWQGYIYPQKIWKIKSGFLRDITLNGSGILSERDSIGGVIWLPSWSVDDALLRTELLRTMDWSLLWELPDKSWAAEWGYALGSEKQSGSFNSIRNYNEYQVEVKRRWQKHLAVVSGEWLSEEREAVVKSDYRRRSLGAYWKYEFWKNTFVQPEAEHKWVDGLYLELPVDMLLRQYGLGIFYKPGAWNGSVNYSWNHLQRSQESGYNFLYSEGFGDGETHRIELTLGGKWYDFLNVYGRYLTRWGAGEGERFQSLSVEAEAVF